MREGGRGAPLQAAMSAPNAADFAPGEPGLSGKVVWLAVIAG
jgi:hypothetical protein